MLFIPFGFFFQDSTLNLFPLQVIAENFKLSLDLIFWRAFTGRQFLNSPGIDWLCKYV